MELLNDKDSQDIVCPFCGETDFDLPGVKWHLLSGHCDPFNDIENIDGKGISDIIGDMKELSDNVFKPLTQQE